MEIDVWKLLQFVLVNQLLKPNKPSCVFSSKSTKITLLQQLHGCPRLGKKVFPFTFLCLSHSQWQSPVPALTCIILFWCIAHSDQGKITNSLLTNVFPLQSLKPETKAQSQMFVAELYFSLRFSRLPSIRFIRCLRYCKSSGRTLQVLTVNGTVGTLVLGIKIPSQFY